LTTGIKLEYIPQLIKFVLNLKILITLIFNFIKRLKKKFDKSKSNNINACILYFLRNFFKNKIKLNFFKFFNVILKKFKKVYKILLFRFSQFNATTSLILLCDVIK